MVKSCLIGEFDKYMYVNMINCMVQNVAMAVKVNGQGHAAHYHMPYDYRN